MRAQGCHNGLDLMTVWICAKLSEDSSSASILFDETEGPMIVKSAFVLVLRDGCHGWNAVQMLLEEGGPPETDDHLQVNLIIHRDGAAISQHDAVKPRKVSNTSTAFVR